MKLYVFLIVLLILSETIFAQSPYKLNNGQEIAITSSSLVALGTGYYLSQNRNTYNINDINKLSSSLINSFDIDATKNYSKGIAKISDYFLYTAILAPTLLFTNKELRSDFSTISVMYAETFLVTAAITTLAKGCIKRTRPYVYNNGVPTEEKMSAEAQMSFFSGHTSIAFASAVFTSTVFGKYFPNSKFRPYVWAGSLIAASSVGYMRYAAGKHFPTDIITGAIIGSAIGYFIPYIHSSEKDSPVDINSTQNLVSFKINF